MHTKAVPRLCCVMWLFALAASGSVFAQTAFQDPVLEGCNLEFLEDVQLPATEAAVLTQLTVKEGSLVSQDEVVARLDDREAKMQLEIARHQAQSAYAKYEDKVEENYARAAADAAEAEVLELREVNSGRVQNVVTQSEMRRAELEWTRAKLQIEKALKDRELALFDFQTRKAEYKAAEQALERRIIRAPFTGEVLEVKRKQSEWTNPGDPIVRLVRYDVLKVEGRVSLEHYSPQEVDGCEVTVEVNVGKNRTETVKGRITRVEQQVQYELDYVFPVEAEIPNSQSDGRWTFMPGQRAKMTIHLATRNPNISRRATP
jgi:multidrug resistance efflux pump